MKINKQTLAIGAGVVIVALILMIGVTMLFSPKTPDAPKQEPNSSETSNVVHNKGTSNTANNKGQPTVLVEFANALCDENYQDILNMLYLPDNSIVSPVHIQEFLENSNIADFLGSDYIAIDNAKETKTSVIGDILLKDNETSCTVIFQINAEGNMVLGMSSAYEERTLIAPGNAEVRVGGITLDTTEAEPYNPKHHPYEEGIVAYKVICPVTDFDAYISTKWADYNLTVTHNEDVNKPYNLVQPKLNESVTEGACAASKDLMNQIITAVVNNQPITDYLADTAPSNLEDQLKEWVQTTIVKGPIKGTPDLQLESVTIYDTEDQTSYVPENNTIHIFTKYTSVWEQNQKHTGQAEFIIKQTNDGYKLVWTNMKDDTFINNALSNF